MEFNIFKNPFGRAVVKSKYDYGYAVNIDAAREKIKDTNTFTVVKDKLSQDFVLVLKKNVGEIQSVKKQTNLAKRPMYDFCKYNFNRKLKSRDLESVEIKDEFTDDLRELLVKISKMIYCDIQNIISNFESLINIKPSEREIFTNIINQNRVYLDIMEQIYFVIANVDEMTACSEIYNKLPNNFCSAVEIVYENLDSVVKKLFRLSRSIDIPQINKQLDLMISNFNNQMNIVNNFLLQC